MENGKDENGIFGEYCSHQNSTLTSNRTNMKNIFQLKWHASRFLSEFNCLLVCQKTIMWPIYYFVFVINFDCMLSIGLRFSFTMLNIKLMCILIRNI